MPDPNTPAADIQGMGLKVKDMELDGKKVSTVGVLCRIVKVLKFPDGTVRMLLRGLNRVEFVERLFLNSIKLAKVRRLTLEPDNSIETVAMVRNAVKQFQEIVSFSPNFPEELKIAIIT